MKTSVFIPTKNPGRAIIDMVEALIDQSYTPDEILIIDSSSTDGSIELLRKKHGALFNNILRVHKISPKNFGHGKTRNLAVKMLTGDVIIFLTQDVTINNASFIKNITEPLRQDTEGKIAATFARQIAKPEHHILEHFFNSFYFPSYDILRMKRLARKLKMKDIFFSNAASCIRRDLLIKLPFDESLIMCEDQKFTFDALSNGFQTLYVSKATVHHSHQYNLSFLFRRYFDCATAFISMEKQTKLNIRSTGLNFIFRELWFVLRHKPSIIPLVILRNIAKSTATELAMFSYKYRKFLKYKKFSRISMTPNYWVGK